jgi:signal transduction histidine kinase
LGRHLREGAKAGLAAAAGLGRQAVSLQLETAELARMHEQAMLKLEPARMKRLAVSRAQAFFTKALTPIVKTHRAARESQLTLNRLTGMLGRCTGRLTTANRRLKAGMLLQRKVEQTLKIAGQDHARLLKESNRLQAGFRQLTHQVLAAQEVERDKLSHELQDEVAQTLLGINVRLLTLKQKARTDTKGLKKDIASTRQLVTRSVKSVQRVATRLGRT